MQSLPNMHESVVITAQTAADREMIQRQIDATDAQINALVYELYGLTEEEVKIIEGTDTHGKSKT